MSASVSKSKPDLICFLTFVEQISLTVPMLENATLQEASFGPDHRRISVGDVVDLRPKEPFCLDGGLCIESLPVAFQTYGTLNADKSNAILVCHGLTGDQYLASDHPVTGKPGWWEMSVGSGKPIDTDKYFVICSNVIGSCMGSWGPKSIDAATGKPYGLNFPVITIADMVRAQVALIDAFGIEQLFAVIGGSMGGMLALTWASLYPERVFAAMPIATSARHSAQNIAFHEIGRQAVMADPDWRDGNYFEAGTYPSKGLAVARMTAHVTYVSQVALAQKFGRHLQDKESIGFGFDADFQVESYLRYQGKSFVERFDPNAYLYITRAMDYFDLAADHGGNLGMAFANTPVRFCVVSFSSDWCFPTEESRDIVRALNAASADVSFAEIQTDKGHDAFLLDVPDFQRTMAGFIDGCWQVKSGGAHGK
ncbi:MAG: homoserine O-acetyltransferase [Rickettsiales bacterium]|nr:homoserine O-acetyltransferase [Rickettsiales bacterium]